jgi:methyl-accepting chemotaxis protein
MWNLNHYRLGQRLAAGFGLLLLLTAVIATLGWWRLGQTMHDVDDSARIQSRASAALKWEAQTLLNVNRTLAIAESGGNQDVKKHFAPLIKETSAQISAIQKELESGATTPEEQAQFADIASRRKTYVTARDSIFSFLEMEDPGAKEALNSQLLPAATRYLTAINSFQVAQRKMADLRSEETHQSVARAQWLLLVLAFASLLAGAVCAWMITRSVTGPLHLAVQATQAIASGNLSQPIDVRGRDEVADLCHGLQDMQGALRQIVGDVRISTDSIKTASDEVSAGSHDLSSRTEQAASSLEQTASTMEQISGTIRHTADAAHTANQLAAGAALAATKGGEVVSQVMSTMDGITHSSKRIGDIIAVIDGIAFQTNILALNAAVEAARAGEQGRGFAVVASEVRALAQRAAGAAKEIKTLIGESSDRVNAGAHLVTEAGTSMAAIVESVQRVADIIGEITSATSEQSDGIAQVNIAVNHLDNMTQQNAALVEESAAASQSLKDQAVKLADVVSVFRIV